MNLQLKAKGKERKWSLDGQEIAFPWPKGLPRGVRTSKKEDGAHVEDPLTRTVLGDRSGNGVS